LRKSPKRAHSEPERLHVFPPPLTRQAKQTQHLECIAPLGRDSATLSKGGSCHLTIQNNSVESAICCMLTLGEGACHGPIYVSGGVYE
jgi:hypothetical protein